MESFMTCLSIVREHGPVTVAANPIYPLDTATNAAGAEATFEVLDADAGELKTLVGEHRCFYIDNNVGVFWARLKSLKPCESTHPGLLHRRNESTLRGVMVIVGDSAVRQ
jgi:hypothetical protein